MGSALVNASVSVLGEVSSDVATSLVVGTLASRASTVAPASRCDEATTAVEVDTLDEDSSAAAPASLATAPVVSSLECAELDGVVVGSRVVVGCSLVPGSDCVSASELEDDELDVAAVVAVGAALVAGGAFPCEHAVTTVMKVRGIAERRAQGVRVIGAT